MSSGSGSVSQRHTRHRALWQGVPRRPGAVVGLGKGKPLLAIKVCVFTLQQQPRAAALATCGADLFICVLPCYCCPWEVSSVSIQEATQSCFGSWASTIRFFHLQRLRQGGKKTEKAKLLCRIHCCKSRVITLNIMSLHTSFPAPTWERSFASGQFLP